MLLANNLDFLAHKNQLLVHFLEKLMETFPAKKLSAQDKNPILTNAIILNHPTVILMIRQQEWFALLKNQKQQMYQGEKKHQHQQHCQHPQENPQQHSKLS